MRSHNLEENWYASVKFDVGLGWISDLNWNTSVSPSRSSQIASWLQALHQDQRAAASDAGLALLLEDHSSLCSSSKKNPPVSMFEGGQTQALLNELESEPEQLPSFQVSIFEG